VVQPGDEQRSVGGVELLPAPAFGEVRVDQCAEDGDAEDLPTWRSALSTAKAIPARSASTADIARVLIGVPHNPMPAPSRAKFHQIAAIPVSGASRTSPRVAAPLTISPVISGRVRRCARL